MEEEANFNSIKVRLKLSHHPTMVERRRHFNSIKVRVKRQMRQRMLMTTVFQFHKGTIKTSFSQFTIFLSAWFQFHKGTIKTARMDGRLNLPSTFQFHKGTIKTTPSAISTSSRPYFNSIKVRLKRQMRQRMLMTTVFQFHKGTIKTRISISLLISWMMISIP